MAYAMVVNDALSLQANQPDPVKLAEVIPDAVEAGAPASRVDDRVGQYPFQLLGQLEAHGLFALDAIRLFESAEVEGASLLTDQTRQAAAVGDQAVEQQ